MHAEQSHAPTDVELGQQRASHAEHDGADISGLGQRAAGVQQGLEIAEELDKEGISVEVIDVRTLVPLDVETIVNSVKKTSRAVVLHEAAKAQGGVQVTRRQTTGP